MKKSIAQQIKDRIKEHGVNYKLQQICLDQIQITYFGPQINQIIQACANLQYVTLCSCNIKDLNDFPNLGRLQYIDLSNNHLKGQALENLSKFENISTLILDNNNISDYSCLKHLKDLRLIELSLKDNPISTNTQYRQRIFNYFGSHLQFLDGMDRNGNKKDESEGSSMADMNDQQLQDDQQISGQESQQNQQSQISQLDSLQKKIKGQSQN